MTVEMPSNPVLARRRAGVLLHPTALPGVSGKLGAAGKNVDADFQAKGFQINLPRKKK